MKALAVAALLLSASSAFGATLRLPPQLRRAPPAIARECPECLATGFMTCGTADVAYGKRFARSALQGRPARGYLVSFVMSGDEFRDLARHTSYDALMAALRERFSRARLVVLDAPGARVLSTPKTVRVDVPAALHACVHASQKPWGCCVAANCREECCEKGLGSPTVSLAWDDGKTGESIELRFHHGTGFSRLTRRGARGQSLYYCLVDGPARIEE